MPPVMLKPSSAASKSSVDPSVRRSVTPGRLRKGLGAANQPALVRNKSVPYGLNVSSSKSPSRLNVAAALRVSSNRGLNVLKTPSKQRATKRVLGLTPSRNSSLQALNISSSYGGDRYIPVRSDTNFELGEHLLSTSMSNRSNNSTLRGGTQSAPGSPDKAYENAMRTLLNDGLSGPSSTNSVNSNGGEHPAPVSAVDTSGYRILAFKKGSAPRAPLGFANQQKVLYTARATPASSCQKSVRRIPQQAERILDAPEYTNDYYLNLLDWGANNLVCVALGPQVYLWTAATGSIEELYSLPMESTDTITSVQFSNDANVVAVALSTGEILLFNTETRRRTRTLHSHTDRVAATAWQEHTLSAGSREGVIHHSDVRVREHHVASSQHHVGEICGLRYSPDGRYLASGSNDNTVAVWSASNLGGRPAHIIMEHTSAVKALAWCPWQSSLLATGGGSTDRQLRMCNVQTGAQISETDTNSQICSIVWSEAHRELLIGAGFPTPQLVIYKYPNMKSPCSG